MTHTDQYLQEAAEIVARLDRDAIERIAALLAGIRAAGGRLFFLGVGGSAANASHAVNDFRKLCGFEAYAPTDNVSELTARTNDDGWELGVRRVAQGQPASSRGRGVRPFGRRRQSRSEHQQQSRARARTRPPGRGHHRRRRRARAADSPPASPTPVVIVPTASAERVTPHTEAFQAVVWHLLVSHPALQQVSTTWESRTR